jgi:hypothetical protein
MGMKQLTIRGVSRDVERRIRAVARKEGVSLNKAALRLLQAAVDAPAPKENSGKIGHSLDRFIGTMSDEEAAAIIEANKVFDVIDPELWK